MNLKRLVPALILTAIVAFITGCQEKPHTVSEFMKNESLLGQVKQACDDGKQDPASLNCRNADTADRKVTAQKEIDSVSKQADSAKW